MYGKRTCTLKYSISLSLSLPHIYSLCTHSCWWYCTLTRTALYQLAAYNITLVTFYMEEQMGFKRGEWKKGSFQYCLQSSLKGSPQQYDDDAVYPPTTRGLQWNKTDWLGRMIYKCVCNPLLSPSTT